MNLPRGLAVDFSPTPRHLSHVPHPEAGMDPIRTRQGDCPSLLGSGLEEEGVGRPDKAAVGSEALLQM